MYNLPWNLLSKPGFSFLQENSFLRVIGHIDLDLPEAPEKAARPPLQPVDLYSRYGPKAEISHIFRAPEKRPPKELSLTFLGLTFLPFLGFLVGVSPSISGVSIDVHVCIKMSIILRVDVEPVDIHPIICLVYALECTTINQLLITYQPCLCLCVDSYCDWVWI